MENPFFYLSPSNPKVIVTIKLYCYGEIFLFDLSNQTVFVNFPDFVF